MLIEVGNDSGMLAAVKTIQSIDRTHRIKSCIIRSVDGKIIIPVSNQDFDNLQILFCLLKPAI